MGGSDSRAAVDAVGEESGEKPRRGGGGAWRLFLIEESRGTRGLPDIVALAQRYRNLPREEIERLRTEAADATSRHRTGGSAFPLRPREQERQVMRASRAAIRNNMTDELRKNLLGQASDPAEQVSTLSVAGRLLPSEFSCSDLQMLRRLAADRSIANQCEGEARADALREHGALGTPWLSPQVQEPIVPAACMLERESATMPCCVPRMIHAEWCMPKLKEAAVSITSAKQMRLESIATLHKALLADWEQKHMVVAAKSVAKLPKTRRSKTAKCLEVGRCFCSPDGAVLRRFGKNVSCALRGMHAKGTPGKDFTVAGSVAILFSGEPTGPL